MSSRTVRPAFSRDGRRQGPLPWYKMPLAAFRYLFVYLPTLSFLMFRRVPLWQQIVCGTVGVAVIGGAGYAFMERMARNRTNRQVNEAWQQFETASRKLDVDGMKEALDKVETARPGDIMVTKRRAALVTGAANDDDQEMIMYWMNRYLSDGKIREAAVEARRRIKSEPSDWRARCVLASEAINAGKLDDAARQLQELPSPLASKQFVGPADLNYAFEMFRISKVDDQSLRLYRATKIVPVLRNAEIVNFDPGEQLELFKCYVASFEDISKFPELGNYWVGSARIAQNLLDDPKTTTQQLILIGLLQDRQMEILGVLVRRRLLTVKQAQPLLEELLERQVSLWSMVKKRDPVAPFGYLGTAKAAYARGKVGEAIGILNEGIEKCEDRARLIQFEFDLYRHLPNQKKHDRMRELLDAYPSPLTAYLYSEAAMATGRPDLAYKASEDALKKWPDILWPIVLQVQVHLDQERFEKALELIESQKKFLYTEPMLAEQYVRALALKKTNDEIRPYLMKLVEETPNPALPIRALRAAVNAGLYEDAAAASARLAERFLSFDRDLQFILGESHALAAAPRPGRDGWDAAKVRVATDALQQVQVNDPTDLHAANMLVMLHLKGARAAENAEGSSVPLREAYEKGTLPEKMLVSLAAVSLAQSRHDEARALLSKAILKNPTAEEYVHLALAYYHLNNLTDARAALREASNLPRNHRVSQELSEALLLINGKKS